MKSEETIIKSFKRGEDQAKEKGIIGAHWLEYYGFNGDPFTEEFVSLEEVERTFVDREDILNELGEYVGGSQYAKNFYHIAIIGSLGSGKSSILRLLFSFALKHYKTIFHDVYNDVIQPFRGEDNLADRIKDSEVKCVFFDDCYPQNRFTLRINHRKRFPGVLISALSPVNSIGDYKIDRRIKLSNIEPKEIIQLLRKRVEMVGKPDTFSDEYYETIANLSMSNPLLAIQTAKAIAKDFFYNKNNKEKFKWILDYYRDTFKEKQENITQGGIN